MLEKIFKLSHYKTNVRTEILAGITTFFTMAYIIVVNPTILSATGMSYGGVFVATILSAVIGTLTMAFFANVPYAQAPGMGMNAFFTYTVVFALGFTWQQALGLVFICGIFNIIITTTSIRKALISAIPESIQKCIGAGIGLFIAYMGLKNGGLLSFTSNPGEYEVLESGTAVINSKIVPSLVNFGDKAVLLSIFAIVITIILMLLNVKGAMFIGIILTTIVGMIFKITPTPTHAGDFFDITSVASIKDTFGAVFSSEGLVSLLKQPDKILLVILTSFAFTLTDMFDTIGTLIGTGNVSGLFTKKEIDEFTKSTDLSTRMDKALFSDAIATSMGSILGTSNVTTFVESSAGIAMGGRTGLTALAAAVMFLLCIPFAPLFAFIPSQATSAALVVVGILMMKPLKDINWDSFEEAVPAFFGLVMMPFAYSITQGVAWAFIMYCAIKIVKGKIKEIHPILGIATILFIVNYIVMAVYKI